MNETGPVKVIIEYVEACRVGSPDRLRRIFHADALMSGYYQGEFYSGSPDPFLEEVDDNPSPSETGEHYAGEIVFANEVGRCASVILKESGFLGGDFTNCFHLAKVDGKWLILSKTYVDEHSGELFQEE